jgi:putative transposase
MARRRGRAKISYPILPQSPEWGAGVSSSRPRDRVECAPGSIFPGDSNPDTSFEMHHTHRTQRRQSYNEPGHAHEITFTCYKRYRFLSAERICTWLFQAIQVARAKRDFSLWAFVFMPEHVHLIIQPRSQTHKISSILQSIKQPVGQRAVAYMKSNAPEWLPRITRNRGGSIERLFWQSGGGYDRNIDEPKTLLSMIDYIHMNPVRRGLVTRPSEWRWSSAGWFAGAPTVDLVPDRIPSEWGS